MYKTKIILWLKYHLPQVHFHKVCVYFSEKWSLREFVEETSPHQTKKVEQGRKITKDVFCSNRIFFFFLQ